MLWFIMMLKRYIRILLQYMKMVLLVIIQEYKKQKEYFAEDLKEFQELYKILADKKNYQNSVKLGLDLSGGMNVIVKADLDAVEKNLKGSSYDAVTVRKDAMAQAIETLTSRIDRFGLTEPVIRQQGEDRIYIEIPGAAQADAINTLIMGKGILNFRLADMDATAAFKEYYMRNKWVVDNEEKIIQLINQFQNNFQEIVYKSKNKRCNVIQNTYIFTR